MQTVIQHKLTETFSPTHLAIENESHLHSGPATDSHFKVVVVSDRFVGKRPVARHQLVYGALADELAGAIHALVIHPFTVEEWQQRAGEVRESAPCRGNVKK